MIPGLLNLIEIWMPSRLFGQRPWQSPFRFPFPVNTGTADTAGTAAPSDNSYLCSLLSESDARTMRKWSFWTSSASAVEMVNDVENLLLPRLFSSPAWYLFDMALMPAAVNIMVVCFAYFDDQTSTKDKSS